MLRRMLIVCLIAGASPTYGQAAGCETVGGELYCPPAPKGDGGDDLAMLAYKWRVDAARRKLAEREAAAQQRGAAPQELRKRVGSLIADGDCTGAYQAALRDGDLDLAAKVKAVCPTQP